MRFLELCAFICVAMLRVFVSLETAYGRDIAVGRDTSFGRTRRHQDALEERPIRQSEGPLDGFGQYGHLARAHALERPVRGSDTGERITRLAEYMTDFVRRADAGDLKCRMYLVKAVERGDRRKEVAQRNAKKAKSEELRKFEEATAEGISTPMPPLEPDVEEATEVKSVRPTAAARADSGRRAAAPGKSPRARQGIAKDAPLFHPPTRNPGERQQPAEAARSRVDASALERNPRQRAPGDAGRPRAVVGRGTAAALPDWPHISPHVEKRPPAGDEARDLSRA